MKMKITSVIPIFMLVMVSFNNNTWGQGGLENFENFPETSSSYKDGIFLGKDGSEWKYVNARGDAYADIEAPNPGLNSEPSAMIESGILTGGIDEFEFEYMQMFSTDVELDVYINDDSVTTVTSDDQKNEVLSSGTIEIKGVDGEFTLRFQNSSSGGQVAIDNIDWFVDTGEPNFLVDPGVLNFSSLKGEGHSEPQSFELTVLNLDETDVTVATSANFEVSEDSITYSNEVKLRDYENDTISVYARLAGGLELGDYSDYITVSGGGAVDDTVAVTGKIVEQFDIPYVNDFRSQENVNIATVQGFNIDNAAIQETSDPYLKIYPNGYMETPPIDFTQTDSLGIKFDATTWGGDDGQELSVLVSNDNGASYDTLQFYTISGDYVTHEYVIDLTDTYDVSDGKIKIQMTGGGNSTRFRKFSIEDLDATIDPVAAEFDLDAPDDVSTKITWNAASSVQVITNNGTALTEGSEEDYTVSANELIINENYLDDELNADGESISLLIRFNAGADVIFNISSTAAPTYAVSYDTNDENATGDVPLDVARYKAGDKVTLNGQGNLALEGHTFVGWNTRADGTGHTYQEGEVFTMGNTDTTFYAVWELAYTVTYDANFENATGNVPSDENDYTIGDEVTVLGQHTLVLDGYAFAGWNTQADGSGETYQEDETFIMGAEDDTLYAIWEIEVYTVIFTVTSEAGVSINGAEIFIDGRTLTTDGSGQVTIDLAYGDYKYDVIAAGYQDFNSSLTVEETDLTEAVTMTEVLYEFSLTASPDEGGTVSDGGKYKEGEEVTITANASNGYEFINWTDKGGNEVSAEAEYTYTMPAENVELIANFEAKATSIDPSYFESLELYPNPTQGEFYLEVDNAEGYVKIHNLTGRLIIKNQINTDRMHIDISGQPDGIYLIVIDSEKNTITRKLIKK